MKIHQSLFQYLLCWQNHVQYIIVTDGWGDPIPWSFWSVFSHWKILNDCPAEQETAGMMLIITTPFPKFQPALWPKKIGSGNKIFGYIQTEITYTIFFSQIWSSLQSTLKTICEFWEYFANIDLQSFLFKFNFVSLIHHFIIKSQSLNLRHSCPKIYNFLQKVGAVTWAWVLLNYYQTLQSIIFYFNIFSFYK